MRLTKRQLKRIIKEEYAKLVKAGLIREAAEDTEEELDVQDADMKLGEADDEEEDEELNGEVDIKEAVQRARLRKIVRQNTRSQRRRR